MLHFITGKVGCGKTTFLHSLIAKKVKESGKNVILIVPKQFTFESDTGILSALGPKDACSVDVLSFSRLAESVLTSCCGISKPVLSDGPNCIIMSFALESIKDRLRYFSKHYNNISFIKKILSEVAQFKKCAITPSDLELAARQLPDGDLKKKALETALIFETYNALVEESYYDDNDLLTYVHNILLDSDFFWGKTVAIDDFSSFTVQEIKLISLMLRDADDVYVTACTDNLENSDESSPFAAVNKTMRRLRREAEKNFVKIAPEIRLTDSKNGFSTYSYPELRALENGIYNSKMQPFEKDVQAVKLFFAPSAREECDYAAAKIKALMRSGKYRCRDIAVVYRNEVPYEKQIRCSFKKYDIPVFEDRRQPIENEPLIIAVRSLLEIFSDGMSTDNIMGYLKTRLSGIDEDEIAAAENYALMWSIGASGWKRPWTDNPDGFGSEMDEEKVSRLAALNETRQKITEPLETFCKKMKDATAAESMECIYNFLIENSIDENLKNYAIALEESGNFELALEQEQVWDMLMEVLDQIANVLGKRSVSPKRLKEIFSLVVSTQSLGKLPNGFDEVYICGCDRIATIMPKVIFVLGANDGKFPRPFDETGVFAQSETQRLRNFLPDIKDGVKQGTMNERFMVYNSLCSAREQLFVSWALTDSSGEKLCESEIVSFIRTILPKVQTVNVSALEPEETIESEKAAFELMAKNWNRNDKKSRTLRAYFSSKPEYAKKMEAIKRACKREDFAFENAETATELFGRNIRLSATRLENYELCPFKFFCQNAMRAKPRQIARLDPAQSGTLVHYVLERLLSQYENKEFLEEPKERLYAKIGEILDSYIETYMGGKKDKSARFMYLYSRMQKVMQTIVDRLVAEFEDSDFVPCDFELEIDYNGEIKPFKVELEQGCIELFGTVDRVDKMDSQGKRYIRVIDYKSGGKTFALSDVLSGLGMQMLLYLISICRTGKKKYGNNIVPAGLLYLPAKFDAYKIERSDDIEKQNMKRLAGGKMDGMILDEGEVVSGMNRSLSGLMIPISVSKKSGALSGTFISLSQLGKLAKKADEIMANMGNELHRGKIPAFPAYGKSYTKTCDYCEYQSVCMRAEGVKKRYLKDMNHSQCLEILDGGDEDGKKLD